MMEPFSLEEDDSGLFLTQEDPKDNEEISNSGILAEGDSCISPCVSFIGGTNYQYSDISDDDGDFFSSQNFRKPSVHGNVTVNEMDEKRVRTGINRLFGLNSKLKSIKKPKVGVTKSVSNVRKFNFLQTQQIRNLKEVKLKERTTSKLNWAINAYKEWREVRLGHSYNAAIFESDISNLNDLKECSFAEALCFFIPEVSKAKGEGLYPAKTLYQLVVALQKYLNVNKIPWKLIDGPQFENVKNVLDNVMKQRTELNIGTTRKQADLITYDQENVLWREGLLGEDTPDKLRDTVLFLLGVNLALRAGDEHYHLRRDMPDKPSQISFERDSNGTRCLVYREDTSTKTNDGGLKQMRKERKVVWVYPNSDNVTRCPVRLVDKYISLCPAYFKKANFYLQSLSRTNPAQWYGEQVVGINSLKKVVKNLLGRANIEGYYTNHSLRRTGSTRLFQAGIERKIVKEVTGHSSDAVDAYQITSELQREEVSKVLACQDSDKSLEIVKRIDESGIGDSDLDEQCHTEVESKIPIVSSVRVNGKTACTCSKTYSPESNNIGEMINGIVQSSKKGRKTVVKIQIEFEDE